MRILMMLIPDAGADAAAGTSMVRLEHFAAAYYVFHDRGIEVVLASPAGGVAVAATGAAPAGKAGMKRCSA